MDESEWQRPKNVTELDIVCGVGAVFLVPKYEDIPGEFKGNFGEAKKWVQVVSDWFFYGIKNVRCMVKDKSIDQLQAIRHLSAILSSFELSHEHKEAGAAYLMSLWFDDMTYEKVDK